MVSHTLTPAIFTTVIITSWVVLTSAEIYTSSFKVQRMVHEEKCVLEQLKIYIDRQQERLNFLSNFYTDRLREVNSRGEIDIDPMHPNAVYNVIKQYASVYSHVLNEKLENFSEVLEKSGVAYMADSDDVRGSRESLLRLQSVYGMKASDMVKGDYFGFQGPQLKPEDAYEIGKIAFSKGQLNESIDWFNTSIAMLLSSKFDMASPSTLALSLGAVQALLGRVYVWNGRPDLAVELFKEAKQLVPGNGDLITLDYELNTNPPNYTPRPPDPDTVNVYRLCSMGKTDYPEEANSRPLFCRYRAALLPYYRFQKEILSVSPFVSVMYHVISDQEAGHIKDHAGGKLQRAFIGQTKTVSDVRTTNTAWTYDRDSAVVASVSKRIECITGLETTERLPDGPSSGEAMQIANYGLGGHYVTHMDTLDSPSLTRELANAGNRLATFLIYLSDVEKGGATVFPRTGISVAPVKNMALFWYNYDTALQEDMQTHHSGCPVVVGQKWIANKWIWTYGNTFRRRCGLTPDTSQLEIEADMRRGYRPS